MHKTLCCITFFDHNIEWFGPYVGSIKYQILDIAVNKT